MKIIHSSKLVSNSIKLCRTLIKFLSKIPYVCPLPISLMYSFNIIVWTKLANFNYGILRLFGGFSEKNPKNSYITFFGNKFYTGQEVGTMSNMNDLKPNWKMLSMITFYRKLKDSIEQSLHKNYVYLWKRV